MKEETIVPTRWRASVPFYIDYYSDRKAVFNIDVLIHYSYSFLMVSDDDIPISFIPVHLFLMQCWSFLFYCCLHSVTYRPDGDIREGIRYRYSEGGVIPPFGRLLRGKMPSFLVRGKTTKFPYNVDQCGRPWPTFISVIAILPFTIPFIPDWHWNLFFIDTDTTIRLHWPIVVFIIVPTVLIDD